MAHLAPLDLTADVRRSCETCRPQLDRALHDGYQDPEWMTPYLATASTKKAPVRVAPVLLHQTFKIQPESAESAKCGFRGLAWASRYILGYDTIAPLGLWDHNTGAIEAPTVAYL